MSNIRIPPFVVILFMFDLALGVAYLGNYLAGKPFAGLNQLLDLNREANLPSWYSSIQWFCVAILLGLFAQANFSVTQRKSWLLAVLPLLFLALSVDEIAQIHEKLGRKSDLLLSGGSRQNTLFYRTGIWMFVVGVPFLIFFVALIFSIRTYFRRTPAVLAKIVLGMAVMLTGATGIEILYNFVPPNSAYTVLEVFAEELCEMLGATIVLWGSYELLESHGFVFKLDRVELD
jgi:hypothetical protein